jgi:hypothetical protein
MWQPLGLDSVRTEPARATVRDDRKQSLLYWEVVLLPAETSAAKLTASRATRAMATARLMLATGDAGEASYEKLTVY